MKPYAELLIQRAIKEGLSVVVIDKRNNKVIGFVVIEDLNTAPLQGLIQETFKWESISNSWTKVQEN